VIGLISDTHGRVRPQLADVFAGVDCIVHAGDVGDAAVLRALAAIAPVEAVSGNVDDRHDPSLPRARTLPVGGRTLHVTHGDELGSPTPEALLARYDGDIWCTATRIGPCCSGRRMDVWRSIRRGGPPRFNLKPSVAILEVVDGRVDVRFIELV
jgi:hypothetical protein